MAMLLTAISANPPTTLNEVLFILVSPFSKVRFLHILTNKVFEFPQSTSALRTPAT